MARRAVPMNFENARIAFRNFEGREQRFNNSGNRNFVLMIDDPKIAQQMKDDGWNVRIKDSEEGDRPFMSLQVAVNFKTYPNVPPAEIYVYTKHNRRKITEENAAELDSLEIETVDLTIRPRFWVDDYGNEKVKAYLKEMHITAVESAWANKYSEYMSPEEDDEVPFH